MQILAFSDLHGDASTLKLLRESTKDESYDCMLIAGDLTNADLISPPEAVQQLKEIFSIMESFKIPYYYVWGTPFREGTLASIMELIEKPGNYEVKEQEGKLVFRSPTETIIMSKAWKQLLKEIEHFMSSVSFGKHLNEEEPVKLGRYWLTSAPERMPKNAIFLKHHYRKIIPKALLQLDGHLHYGQHVFNYLNLGFLHRDAAHNASPMIGCYWELTLEDSTVSFNFKNLDGKLKEFRCPDHPGEGTFYIPYYWKKCPICFNPDEAMNREKK
jgi:predicted MPP superfamily phosphohydrolase